MSFTVAKILDHGTANPIVSRLTLQIFRIIDQCNMPQEARGSVKVIYMNSLMKKLLRCWEIAERYKGEFIKEMDAYKRRPKHPQMVAVPCVTRLEEECHNFLYEAKSFIRDLLKAFNLLNGTVFVEASDYFRPEKPKKGKQSLISFAESTFGRNDPKTELFKQLLPTVERVVNYRNAVEHPEGYSGTLQIRNFRLDPNGKFSEPGWWTEKDGKKGPESSIRADLYGITENLLMLAEEMFVLWAMDNLQFPQFSRIALVPEEKRDPNNPILYVVTASAELEKKIANLQAQQSQASAG
jgi:hypothetical protein